MEAAAAWHTSIPTLDITLWGDLGVSLGLKAGALMGQDLGLGVQDRRSSEEDGGLHDPVARLHPLKLLEGRGQQEAPGGRAEAFQDWFDSWSPPPLTTHRVRAETQAMVGGDSGQEGSG